MASPLVSPEEWLKRMKASAITVVEIIDKPGEQQQKPEILLPNFAAAIFFSAMEVYGREHMMDLLGGKTHEYDCAVSGICIECGNPLGEGDHAQCVLMRGSLSSDEPFGTWAIRQ